MKTPLFLFFVLVLFFVQSFALSAPSSLPQDQCSQCEQIVTFLEDWIENNSTDAQIEQYLETLCQVFPGIQALCDQMTQWGIEYFIQYLKSNENPQALCQQIGLCTSRVTVVAAPSQDSCSGCTTLVGAIESWIASSATESEIEAALDTVCQMIPSLDQPVCFF